jgi:hypothetical protein
MEADSSNKITILPAGPGVGAARREDGVIRTVRAMKNAKLVTNRIIFKKQTEGNISGPHVETAAFYGNKQLRR